ncbi:hypothetical protein [Chitinilyticum piscinae]|nr:hypothetical protein [Chitinilyticum piscinae]
MHKATRKPPRTTCSRPAFVTLRQAKTRQRIPLLPTPDWSERD